MNAHIQHICEDEVLNAIGNGLMVVSEDGVILTANHDMEAITGFSRNELIGADCTILGCDVCDKSRFDSKENWCMLFEVGKVKNKRCLLTRKDGTYVSVSKNALVLKDDDGEIVGALETFIDISELDKKDQKIFELESRLNQETGFFGMIGRSAPMKAIYQIIAKVADSDAPVIITGESGTGKELVAQAIHELGRRREGPFVKFNCAALNSSLCESELFGHTKGAFTGAYRHRIGRFEAAHGGDIFLDEIGDISLSVQAMLLRVLELKKFERVGDNRSVHADVRVITATNRNLMEMISQGLFREDLFFRINVVPIHLPPLRERREDIPVLAEAFIHELRTKNNKAIVGVAPDLMNLLMNYRWPGNIRELKSVLEYAFCIAPPGIIRLEHIPAYIPLPEELKSASLSGTVTTASALENESAEKTALLETLCLCNGNKSQTAKLLGVHRMTVWNRMRKYGIQLTQNIDQTWNTNVSQTKSSQ
ncbi:MAG: sigma 54-interacting transcriptional regulator [Deltaproteobacteria bacterium]|nr:sigma 54-interacting transcriptional regulator [Deltaproteobacteria bacterium]